MKAAILDRTNEPLKLTQVPEPQPKGPEVVVKVLSSGLCHTDLHLWEGHYGPLKIEERGVKLPLIMGHEVAGSVATIGTDVQERSHVEVGDKVIVYPWIGDGTCKTCISGNEHLCNSVKPLGILTDGGFAEYLKVPHYRYLMKIGNLSPDSAAPLACAGITAYSAIKKAGVSPGDFLVVLGIGGLGHFAVQLAHRLYGPTIIAVDTRNEALTLAKRAGATHTINASQQDYVEEILKITNGAGADAVIDFVNITSTSFNAFRSLRRGGRLVLVGLSGDYSKFILPLVAMRGITIFGSYVGNLSDLMELIPLLRTGTIEPAITAMPLEKVNEAMHSLRANEIIGRTVLNP
jgi:propanol-preferring alcohol dehydrogenase